MTNDQTAKTVLDTELHIKEILGSIDREREREIIARRFGLFDRKETLEQIGEFLSITRERVRQLEKSVIARLKSMAELNQLPRINSIEEELLAYLKDNGNIARVSNISAKVTQENTRIDQARVAFLSGLCPKLSVIDENDRFFLSVAISDVMDEKDIKTSVAKIVDAIKSIGEPATVEKVDEQIGAKNIAQTQALATISRDLATLNNRWGLVRWPMVNPKNIRDKIYVILKENGNHMHFNDISKAIKESDFKRKNVTTQAIHNELIKDKRFILIGRGIYALKEWGYQQGTVADIISAVLREAKQPLHRDEIVKRVLKSRFVKETTILLNLQGKAQFRRVAKATYELAETE